MTTFLRLLSIIICAAGIIGGLVLIVQALPAESYGDVNVFLAGYGAAALISGLFWSVLGMVVAKGVEAVTQQESSASDSSVEEENTIEPVEIFLVVFLVIAGLVLAWAAMIG